MANKEKETKNKKSFFKDFKAELKKVIWPTPKQLVNNTAAVVVIVIITAVTVFALDLAFEALNKYGINPIKSKVRGTETVVINQNIDEGSSVEENNVAGNATTNEVEVQNVTGTVQANNVAENVNNEETTNNINE